MTLSASSNILKGSSPRNRSAVGPAAGKTAPRLIQDLFTYDPEYEERAGRNLLTSQPPYYDPKAEPTRAVPVRNCRHQLLIKHDQSVLPRDEEPPNGNVYKVACFCKTCRWHITLYADCREDGVRNTPCGPGVSDPIHHFLYVLGDSERGPHLAQRNYVFQCSAPKCPIGLTVDMRPPRFSQEQVTLLTDKEMLRRRLEKAKEIYGEPNEVQVARPVDSLDFLCTYLTDSLNPQPGKTRIPVKNRKFAKTFGRDCDSILTYLGFTFQKDDSQEDFWHLPVLPGAGDPLDGENHRTQIEDAKYELQALILRWPAAERTSTRHVVSLPPSARPLIEKALGCRQYPKRVTPGSRHSDSEEDHPYYAGLGALGDFNDDLLFFAFSCQVQTDQPNSAYYYECLKGIAIGRASSPLEESVQILASEGYRTRQEVAEAYRFIGVDPSHSHMEFLTDEHIIGQFRARLQDIGPGAVEETRTALRVIGVARNSRKIVQEASNAIETYEQALSWLDLDKSASDEWVVSVYAIKCKEDELNARKAVDIIAEHTKSQALKDFLASGRVPEGGEMEIGDAYALLDINDRSQALDPEMLRTQVDVFIADCPDRKEKFEQAYALIIKSREDNLNRSQRAMAHPLDMWPVGCLNNGNTCYLNSVLQFLFTIKPLRDLVLDCDKHFQDVSPEALQSKRVGRSHVTVEKVQRAQQFVRELGGLFRSMISANADRVRPKIELAALALARDGPDEVARTAPPTAPPSPPPSPKLGLGNSGLGTMDGLPVVGPTNNSGVSPHGRPEHDPTPEKPEQVDDTGNTAQVDSDGDHLMESGACVKGDTPKFTEPPKQPTRPPPVPPRPLDVKKIEGLAAQQDAAEILNRIFELMSCAIAGEGTMEDGEQLDAIKRLFFSTVTTVSDSDGKVTRSTTPRDFHMVSPGRRDRPLYAALDDEFSLSEVSETQSKTDGADSRSVRRIFEYIDSASPIQIINVRRLLFENNKAIKDESHLALDNPLYLDRYLGKTASLSEEALQSLRTEHWKLRAELTLLEARKKELHETALKTDLGVVVDEAANFIKGLDDVAVDPEFMDTEGDSPSHAELVNRLEIRASELRSEMEDLEDRLKELDEQINKVFEDCKDHPYRLHAVFMHRGSAKGGHYWICIYDAQNNVWRKYNDEHVDEVDVKEVFEDGKTGNSTGLVYVRDDSVNELTEAVCRALDKDTEMSESIAEMTGSPLVGAHAVAQKAADMLQGSQEEGEMQVIDGIKPAGDETKSKFDSVS